MVAPLVGCWYSYLPGCRHRLLPTVIKEYGTEKFEKIMPFATVNELPVKLGQQVVIVLS